MTTTATFPAAEYGTPWLWVTAADGVVYQVDGATGEVAGVVEVGGAPAFPAVGHGGRWVSDCDASLVDLISPGSAELVASIPVAGCPSEPAPGLGLVLVLARDRGTVVGIDPVSLEVVGDLLTVGNKAPAPLRRLPLH